MTSKFTVSRKLQIIFAVMLTIEAGIIAASVIARLQRGAEARFDAYRQEELAKTEAALRSHVDVAFSVIESNHRLASDPEFLKQRYGAELRKAIDLAQGVIEQTLRTATAAGHSQEEAQRRAILAIKELRFGGGSGYFWVNDLGKPCPRMIMHATLPNLDGKVLDAPEFNCANGRGDNLFTAFVNVCEANGEGYVPYLWPKPTANGLTERQPKLSYVRLLKELGWIVGTGVYVDDALRDAKLRSIDDIKNMRWDRGVGYLWINDLGRPYPRMVMHPTQADLDGKILDAPEFDCANADEAKGIAENANLFASAVKVSEAFGEGTVDYLWPKPSKTGLTAKQPKRSYVRLYRPYGWVIGSGTYIDDIDATILAKRMTLQQEVNQSIGLVVFVAAISVIFCVWLISRLVDAGIVSRLNRVTRLAKQISLGSLPDLVEVDAWDEIGDLERACNAMVANARQIVVQTKSLAAGDYALSLVPRSEEDPLIDSLIAMTKALRLFKEETEQRNWLKTGLAELSERLRGDRVSEVIAQEALNYLSPYVGAPVGALFLFEEEELTLVASYAGPKPQVPPTTLRCGEGLVGQCASTRSTIVVQSVPDHWMRVTSGLGDGSPRTLVIIPLVHGSQIAGVLELGFLTDVTPVQRELVEMIRETLAAALLSARSRAQVAQLLERTRKQAAELAQQQEELRVSNEELEERSELLEKQALQLRNQQEELQQSNEELEEHTQALEKARGELMRKADDLERANRYKSEFLANMSHELRTPLNSMLILSHLLANNKEGKIPEEKQREFAETIHKAGADLLNLINDILDLSKIEAGKMEFHFEEVNVPDMLHGMEQMLRHGAEAKGLEFVVRLAASAPEKIRTDVQRLQQVLKNLIGNAIKFTERGSVTLEASSDQVGASPFVVLRVTDTGVGIPADKKDIVFEAFKQADGSTNRKYGGTGLGLSISRELARHLGGEVFLERSEVGVGSTFTLRLPVAEVGQSSAAVSVTRREEPARIEPVRDYSPVVEEKGEPSEPVEVVPDDRDVLRPGQSCLLVVEDDPAFARILVDLVRSRGFSALWAGEGQAALRLAKAHGPKGIFLDVMLPGMDGWSVMRHLKDEPATRHIPVHFISCLDRSMEGLRMGAVGYLTKPVTVDQLQEAISRIERATSRGMRQLLVVEDNEVEAAGILELLAGDDVQAITASSGAEAIRLLGEKRFDCVVLDLGLTDMSGFDLLEHVRSKPELAALPVIIHTGRDLTKEEEMRLRKYTESIIVKGAKSPERLLDEATLFLHLVEEDMPEVKQRMLRMAHDKEALLAGKKVLLVDDDIRNVYSLTSVLEGLGMVVVPAMDGKEALDKLEGAEVDLVLMDIMMPVMDGYEATKAIRAQERFKTLPVIALTAKAMKGDRERCIAAGASDYLAKPVDVNQLVTLLRVWIGR